MDLDEAVCLVPAHLRSRPRGRSEPSRGTPRSAGPRAKLRARTAYDSSSRRPKWVPKDRDPSHEEDDGGATRGAPAASSGATRGPRDARSRSRRRSPSTRPPRSASRSRPYDPDAEAPIVTDDAPGVARKYVDEEVMEYWKKEGWSEHRIRHYISTQYAPRDEKGKIIISIRKGKVMTQKI